MHEEEDNKCAKKKDFLTANISIILFQSVPMKYKDSESSIVSHTIGSERTLLDFVACQIATLFSVLAVTIERVETYQDYISVSR